MTRPIRILASVLLSVAWGSCSERALPKLPLPAAEPALALVVGGREVDLLAVVDNATPGISRDDYLAGYHALFEALIDKAGCGSSGLVRCLAVDARVGVVTSDLGAGQFTYEGATGHCLPGGDGGRLRTTAYEPGCPLPDRPWLSYSDGETNVPGAGGDALSRFLAGFDCVAAMSLRGCDFQHQLEAARRAIDPRLDVNPGFLRESALLVVAVVTDEDDCSAARPELFSTDKSLLDELGPLTDFRCSEFGWQCDEALRPVGDKHNCRPGLDWLVKVEDYAAFLRGLRPGRALFFTVAGPPAPVSVGRNGLYPQLKESCMSASARGVPGIRLRALAAALGPQALFNPAGVDACTQVLAPAFKALAETVLRHLGSQCVPAPLITGSGALVCSAGEELAPGVTCSGDCLELAECTVTEVTAGASGAPRSIPRCPAAVTGTDCGGSCPCWRLVRMPDQCSALTTGSPYALQVLRATGLLAPFGSHAVATCRTTPAPWGSDALATAPQCGQR